MRAFDPAAVVERLRGVGGGYEIVHESPGLELGVYVLAARATDGKGSVQPAEPVWNPSGYLANAVHTVPVEVRA